MKKYWDNADVTDSNGTLALQVDGYDLMYCSKTQPGSRDLYVDGTNEDGAYAGDGKLAPFVVFDQDAQEDIAGPFGTREEAERAMKDLQPRALTDEQHQAWVDLIAQAPRVQETLTRLVTWLEENEDIEHDQFGCNSSGEFGPTSRKECPFCSAKDLVAELEKEES